MRVFIADDSKLMQERLAAILTELPGVEIVGQAFDGLTATRLISEIKPDVVLLDIRMPKKNGMDVLLTIKKDSQIPRVIVFTNYPYPQYKKKCTELGADYFLHKDSEFDKLSGTIKRLSEDFAA